MLGVAAIAVCALIYFIVRAALNRPPSAPSTLPPELALQNQQRRDQEHLKLLSIFHFLFAGLALLGVGFLFVHYAIMHTFFSNPEMCRGQPVPPRAFVDAFIWMYLFFNLILVAGSVPLWQRRHRVFSLVIGGLNCLQIPFGTTLGVFTIMASAAYLDPPKTTIPALKSVTDSYYFMLQYWN